MHILKVLIHTVIVIVCLGIIFGISFGVINNNTKKRSNQIKTECHIMSKSMINYTCYEKLCNQTFKSCEEMISSNETGICCDDSSTCDLTSCYVIESTCFDAIFNIDYSVQGKNQPMSTTITQTNFDPEIFSTLKSNFTCFYLKSDPSQVILHPTPKYEWWIIYIISLVAAIMIAYITTVRIYHRCVNSQVCC